MPDADLSADTRLQLAPGIRTRLDAAGHVLVDAPDGTIIDVGPNGFATLVDVRAAAQPRSGDRTTRERQQWLD